MDVVVEVVAVNVSVLVVVDGIMLMGCCGCGYSSRV